MIIGIIAFLLLIGATIFFYKMIDVFEEPTTFKCLIGGFFLVYALVAICFKAVLPPVDGTPAPVGAVVGGVADQFSGIHVPDLSSAFNSLFPGSL